MKSFRRPFTLIELLVVVAIIAILAGLLLPAVAGARNRAKIVKAKTAMNSLRTAISMYESDYGVLPVGSAALDWIVLNDAKYGELIDILQGGNPRQKRYLDIIPDQGPGSYNDPWGFRFMVALDSNYDGDVAHDDSGTQADSTPIYDRDGDGTQDPIFERVAVWSRGKNKIDENGLEDDVITWGD